MTIPVALAGVSGISSVSGIFGNVAKPLRHLRSLERRPLSNLSVSLSLASSPCRGALGKKVTFSMKPICVCWKTSRNAKASHFGRGVCGADGEGKDADKKQKTQRYDLCLSETSYRCAFVFYFAGLALSGAGAPALPKGEPLAKRFRFR